jgi:hypothetical protein
MTNAPDYAYAIVRVDEYQGEDCPEELKVVVKEIVWEEETARREVARLNGLGKKGVRYFSQATRIEKLSPAPPAVQSGWGPLFELVALQALAIHYPAVRLTTQGRETVVPPAIMRRTAVAPDAKATATSVAGGWE